MSHRGSIRHYSENILKIETGLARQDNLEASFKTLFETICEDYPGEGYESAEYHVNVVTGVEGALRSFGYVWMSDPRICRMLLGKNPDGSERIHEYDDPDWVPSSDQSNESSEDSDKTKSMKESPEIFHQSSWADLQDEEEEEEEKHRCPKIVEKLPPLITLPGYKYDDAQKKAIYEKKKAELESFKEDTSNIEVPETGGFIILGPAYIIPLDEEYEANVLYCSITPMWITEEMIRPHFERYNTDNSYKTDHRKKGAKGPRVKKYPSVSFNSIRNKDESKSVNDQRKGCFITFSPNKIDDSSFALLMTRKMWIDNLDDIRANEEAKAAGKPEIKVRRGLVIFSHWRKSKKQYNRN